MKQKIQTLSALLLALALSLSLSVPALAAEQDGTAGAKAAAEAAMTYGQAAQIAWAVWQDGEIAESGSSVPPSSEAPAGGKDLYGVGSVSKIYTTVAVMQLAERGELSLDEPVTAYLPAFKMADPRYQDITVRMLLDHSSGLMGSSMSSALLLEDASTAAADRLLDVLAGQRLKADPGAYSVYCNDGFTLAELVVEAVSGMDFEAYLQENVFAPAGLEETYTPAGILGGDARDRVVDAYQAGESGPMPMDCLGIVGAGGIYATAEDLARFGGALTGGELLGGASLDAMAAPEYARGLWPEEGPDALAFGLGWDNVEWYPFAQSGITALVKGGDTQYYHAGLVVLPEHDLAAAVVSSGGVSTYDELAASMMLVEALEAKGVEVDQTPLALPEAEPAAMPEELTELSGYYASLYTYKIDVAKDGELTLHYTTMPGVPDQVFTYHSDGSFRDEEGTAAVYLVEEDNGQTYLRQWTFTDLPGLTGLPGNSYTAMKLPENEISPELQALWDTRMSETSVVPVNERYSSQVYAVLGTAMAAEAAQDVPAPESVPGYTGSMKIVDEDHAQYAPQIPGTAGRDGVDVTFRRDGDGVLWMEQSNGSVAMDLEAVPELSIGKDGRAACTVGPDGYARWYKIGAGAAGKTMTVQLPEDAGFWVYDSEGGIAASSVLRGDRSVELPEDGLAVFAGDPGAVFRMTFR